MTVAICPRGSLILFRLARFSMNADRGAGGNVPGGRKARPYVRLSGSRRGGGHPSRNTVAIRFAAT
jgi:hypothetical protein